MRILVLGASGMLGNAMLRVMDERQDFELFGTVCSGNVSQFFSERIAQNKRCLVLPFPIAMMKFLANLLAKSAAVDRLTQSLVVDSSKIRQELDWVPPFTMAQGLCATAELFQS